ncbi:MAG: hypothetical protein AB1425_15025 [Actinomycetota bacterium]
MADESIRLARAAAEAALATEGIHTLGKGRYAEAATYGPGEKVSGVVVRDDAVEVHVVVGYPLSRPIPEIARRVVERVSERTGGRRVAVVVEDLEVAEDENL